MTADLSLACVACGKPWRRTRGCCQRCYAAHLAAVRAGETTWAALEAAGLSLPTKGRTTGRAIKAMWDEWERRRAAT